MGIYDRDYYRTPPRSSAGQMGMWSVTTWLIAINIAVYVLDHVLFAATVHDQTQPPLTGLGHFSLSTAISHLEVWRFITFQFLHAGLTHLVFNMFALYFFGPMVESYFGRRRFLAFYLLCGIGGPLAYLILWAAHLLYVNAATSLVGASAGIFGILIAASQIAPETTVLIYGVIPMRLRTLAWLLLGIAIYTVLKFGGTGQANAGGQAAHLGGAAVGYLLVSFPQALRFADMDFHKRRPPF